MRFGHRDHPIQAFPPCCADDALAERIRLRTRNGGSQYLDSQGSDRIVKVLGEDPISIVDQVAMPSSSPHDFPQLLQSPVGVRVRRHIDMGQATRAVLDHHEHVQHPERRSDSDEEVACKDRRGVVTQKCRPALIAARMTGWP